MPVNIKAGQHTVYWGDSLLLGGAIHGVSYAQNPLDVWKGFATPGSEAKELFRPRGGITLQAQPTKELSVAGQWFYNWQADRIPESGSYLTIQDPLNFGGDSFIFGPNPLAAAIPGAPAYLRLWRAQDIKPPANSGSLGDWGVSARWSPDWLDGTLGFYYRNTTDVLPAGDGDAGRRSRCRRRSARARGGAPLPGGTLCFVNPNATTVADLQKFGKLGLYNGAYGDNIHIYGITLAKSIAGVSVGAELSYRQNMPLAERPGPGAARGVRAARARLDRDDGGAHERHAWRAGRYHARRAQRGQHLPVDPAVRYRGARGRAHLDAMVEGHAERGGVQGTQQLHADRQAVEELLRSRDQLHADVVPGFPGRRPACARHLEPGHLRQLRPSLFGGSEDGGNWSAGVAADIYQKYRIDLKYSGYYGNYSTTPTGATPAGGVMGVPNGANASLSDRGWVSLTFKTTFLNRRRQPSCFARHCWPRASRRYFSGAAFAAVSADEAKQLGTTLTAGRRGKGRQQGRHDSRVHRRHQGAGGFQGGQRLSPRSVRQREASPRRSPARTWPRTPTS